jgi:hypothetical protein
VQWRMAGLQINSTGMLNPPVEKYIARLLYQIEKRQALPELFIESVESLFNEWHRVELAELFVELLDYGPVKDALAEQMISNMEKRMPEPHQEPEEIHWHGR